MPMAGQDVEVNGLKNDERLLIPRRALGALSRLADAEEGDVPVQIAKDDSHLFFTVGDSVLISRMISGQFPDYEAALPKSNGIVATLDAAAFREALERVSLLAPERGHGVSFAWDPGRITLSATGSDAGEATESLDATYSGEPLRIEFNCLFVMDFFSAVRTGQVEIALKDEQSAVEFRPLEDEHGQYRYILMPMRL